MRNSMSLELRPTPRSNLGKNDLPRESTTSLQDHDNELITKWFAESAGAFGSGKEVAFALKVDQSFVSLLKGGAKAVAGRYLIPLLRKHDSAIALLTSMIEFAGRDVALEMITVLCKMTGLETPKPKKRLAKADVRKQLDIEFKKQPALVELFLGQVARAFGAELEEVKDAWCESTGVGE